MTTRTSRTLEDLVELQDKAITALEMALKATQLALEALQRARTEQGTPQTCIWPTPEPSPATGSYSYVPQLWGGATFTYTAGGEQTVTTTDGAAQSLQYDAYQKAQCAMNMAGKAVYALQSQRTSDVPQGGNI